MSPTDALTTASVVALMLATSALAAWIPARRAMNVQPMTALRCE